jgi:hypothetical protein
LKLGQRASVVIEKEDPRRNDSPESDGEDGGGGLTPSKRALAKVGSWQTVGYLAAGICNVKGPPGCSGRHPLASASRIAIDTTFGVTEAPGA